MVFARVSEPPMLYYSPYNYIEKPQSRCLYIAIITCYNEQTISLRYRFEYFISLLYVIYEFTMYDMRSASFSC